MKDHREQKIIREKIHTDIVIIEPVNWLNKYGSL